MVFYIFRFSFFGIFSVETLTKEEEYRELKSISEGEEVLLLPPVNAFVFVTSSSVIVHCVLCVLLLSVTRAKPDSARYCIRVQTNISHWNLTKPPIRRISQRPSSKTVPRCLIYASQRRKYPVSVSKHKKKLKLHIAKISVLNFVKLFWSTKN